MRHNTFQNMLEELLDNSDDVLIAGNSKRCALYCSIDGSMELLIGDFSGTPEEQEAEARRVLSDSPTDKGPAAA